MKETASLGIAVIGLAGRFPQAADIEAFWTLLKNGREAVTAFSDEELLASGVSLSLLQNPDYVKAGAIVPDIEYFDASFFKMSARDAEIADPQHRVLMECAWQALEHAGYPPAKTEARIGIYAGVGENTYRRLHLEPNLPALWNTIGDYRVSTLNTGDFLATYTAYKLNLTGPAVTVQTACSTSLVAIHMACQSLLNVECDLALAGGVSIFLPQGRGYLYQEGMIASPDGHCRAFDRQAKGTIHSGGVGMVLLKRLDEAVADGDTIHAVILGSAINNDGADKIGFTAPSVGGQVDVILEAQAAAGVHPDEVSYIEAHGTATPLGDLIEIQALTQAFRARTQRKGYCAIGSVKTNIGHADTAAGVAGLIKTVLALKHRQLPPSLHFETPNPQIDIANSPFFVNNRLRDWEVNGNARRCAAVSAFGIGGTNAHVILAEAPSSAAVRQHSHSDHQLWRLLCLSARTGTALENASRNLGRHLRKEAGTDLADVAYTLHVGRQDFSHRQIVVCRDTEEASAILQTPDLQGIVSREAAEAPPDIVFMFPGGGAQYPNMGRDLYEGNGIDGLVPYREHVDRCLAILQSRFGIDLKPILFPGHGTAGQSSQVLEEAARILERPSLACPALFITEYALANLWLSWGIRPGSMIGHSMGEYVAACLAGVFSLEDALSIVTWRGQLFETIPAGAMLSVHLPPAELETRLNGEIAIAAVNKHSLCTVSGPSNAVNRLADRLTAEGIVCNRVRISTAAHTPMLEPILDEFRQRLQQVRFSPFTIPFISNVTGAWIRPDEAMSPDYWVRHMRHTVRFADGVDELLREPNRLFLEVGPGLTLRSMVEAHTGKRESHTVLSSLRHPADLKPDCQYFLQILGQLWQHGIAVNWRLLYSSQQRLRIPLPAYPFERRKYWVDASGEGMRQMPKLPESAAPQNAEPIVPPPPPAGSQSERTPSALQREIASIWSQALGIAEIEPEADFFELGGDSLLAAQLAARLRERFNVHLGAHSLLEAPTVAQLARLIAAGMQPSKRPRLPELLVELQAGNPVRKPLVLMHPVGGHVFFYNQLVRQLDPELPVYGIRAQGLEGEAEPLTSVAEMTQVYTAALQALQPQGPYYLGGASFGGVLAFAMAQKLIAQAQEVAFLGLIDTPSPGNMPEPFDEIADILFYLLKVGQDMDVDKAALRAMDETRQLSFFLQHSRWRFSSPRELKTMLNIFKANERAMLDYVPQVYPGKLHFFLARERDAFSPQAPAHGWIELAGQGMEIHPVPGNHITMNEAPHVKHLAGRLEQSLKQCLTNKPNELKGEMKYEYFGS